MRNDTAMRKRRHAEEKRGAMLALGLKCLRQGHAMPRILDRRCEAELVTLRLFPNSKHKNLVGGQRCLSQLIHSAAPRAFDQLRLG